MVIYAEGVLQKLILAMSLLYPLQTKISGYMGISMSVHLSFRLYVCLSLSRV